jgi:hypothetical protein
VSVRLQFRARDRQLSSNIHGEPLTWAPTIHLRAADWEDLGRRPLVATHTLHESGLFSDSALIDLLDQFPRQYLYAMSMGADPTHPEENRLALTDGVSGTDLLRAVTNGRLWLNITRVDRADRRYRLLIDEIHAQLAAQVPGFRPVGTQGTLLISSPRALVYYHVDGPASILWHIRGRKRIWVYPALDTRYAAREAVEDICAGARHEYLPFDRAYDEGAISYELEAGQWTAWAQNAPHRVTNGDSVNVSLSTEYFTRESRRRARVYAANRLLRVRFGFSNLSAQEHGPAAWMKVVTHGLARRVGLVPARTKRHAATMRVEPDAPGGAVDLEDAGNAARVHA